VAQSVKLFHGRSQAVGSWLPPFELVARLVASGQERSHLCAEQVHGTCGPGYSGPLQFSGSRASYWLKMAQVRCAEQDRGTALSSDGNDCTIVSPVTSCAQDWPKV